MVEEKHCSSDASFLNLYPTLMVLNYYAISWFSMAPNICKSYKVLYNMLEFSI